MSILIYAHVLTGLVGILSGVIAVVGIYYRRPFAIVNAMFLVTTATACVTGFVFLPTGGVTSAQVVAFFLFALLAAAAYARFVQRREGSWNQVYALTAVGALFLNVLITTAQSFLHVRFLSALAPTQHSLIYVMVKLTLLLLFIAAAIITALRAGRS